MTGVAKKNWKIEKNVGSRRRQATPREAPRHPCRITAQQYTMPRLTAGAARLANRQLVLALHASEPELKATAIGRRLGINEATVRSILKRYRNNSIRWSTLSHIQVHGAFLADQGVNVLPNWPPNSPDLNPVEHFWAWISRQLIGKQFRNAAELEAAVRQAWADKPSDLIPKLYGSMVRRLTAVQVAKGAATKY